MIDLKKINVLLSPIEMKKIFKKKSKQVGISSKNIKKIQIKPLKRYTDQRSFSLVAIYSLDNKKKIIGTANSDGKREYVFKISSLIFKYYSKIKIKNFSFPRPYCYIKQLGLFLREYLKGENFGKMLKKGGRIKQVYISRIAEMLSFFQSINASKKFVKKGTDFYDIEKNINILKQRKKKEAKMLNEVFKKLKKEIRGYERENKNKVLVHGDPNPYNLFFEKNKIKLADFGSCHLGDRISDLANLFSHFKITLDFKISKEKINSFKILLLEEYQKLNKKISEIEKEKLKTYESYFSLLSISHIMVWGNYPRAAKLFNKFKKTL